MIKEYDISVSMRDGVHLFVDVYRPDGAGRFPVLYACGPHNKDLQRPEIGENLGAAQPAWSKMWFGVLEAGDSKRFVANGYVHIVSQMRGGHKSEGMPGQGDWWDEYDTIDWIVSQPWCDGNVGMVGLSGFAAQQWKAAAQGHPSLKAIFPFDATGVYGGPRGFREANPGGVIGTMFYHLGLFNSMHMQLGTPPELPPEVEEAWQVAMADPDYMMYVNLYNILALRGQRDPDVFYDLLFPFEAREAVARAEECS